ncbi:hypothetical protein I350_05888 [Cryptococcus amylolentus CBS 6273]|uniref:Transcription and mRNA export factor SUS1 n=1 Tax=Cryptococcus amylolentus CBS 6273 TaxID=1296118 RepID=A0A1E3JQD8_9TREE|nr:hypothetical protein I350_05888 [Cryptococcus amylolentus CBS 6273]
MSQTTTPDEATLNAIRQRLMETGDWERYVQLSTDPYYGYGEEDDEADHDGCRIQKLLRAHLEESGWVDDLKDLAKERARAQEMPNLEALVKEISENAAGMVNESVRRDVTVEIESVLDREVDQA